MPFADRSDAGRRLAAALTGRGLGDAVVVGLPRGGVLVAFEVARALGATLDVIVVRKLGVPFQPELGMGAVGESGNTVVNERLVRVTGVSDREFAEVERRERAEVERQARRFRSGRPRVPLSGRTVVVVDDGMATGATARAACRIARSEGARRVVLAVPVAAADTARRMRPEADEMVCLETPRALVSIGQFYSDFTQSDDETVVALLSRSGSQPNAPGAGAEPA